MWFGVAQLEVNYCDVGWNDCSDVECVCAYACVCLFARVRLRVQGVCYTVLQRGTEEKGSSDDWSHEIIFSVFLYRPGIRMFM